MTAIPKNPRVSTFATAFATDMRAEASKASGRDGRLSYKELKRAIAAGKLNPVVSDNLRNYFEKSGLATSNRSVALGTIEADANAYAFRAAIAVAGGDFHVSIADAAKLNADLKDNYQALTHVTIPLGPAPTRAEALAAALGELAGGPKTGLVRALTANDYQAGALPSKVLAEVENAGEMDEVVDASFVFRDKAQTQLIGYGLQRTHDSKPGVSVSIVNADNETIAGG